MKSCCTHYIATERSTPSVSVSCNSGTRTYQMESNLCSCNAALSQQHQKLNILLNIKYSVRSKALFNVNPTFTPPHALAVVGLTLSVPHPIHFGGHSSSRVTSTPTPFPCINGPSSSRDDSTPTTHQCALMVLAIIGLITIDSSLDNVMSRFLILTLIYN